MGYFEITVLNEDAPRGNFKHAVFDFDGTISLIREGWQQIMVPYFADEMKDTPNGKDIPLDDLAEQAREFVFVNTGKQTIYQCIELAERVEKLGKTPLDPQDYKDEYHRRLAERIADRVKGLGDKTLDPRDYVVPGSFELLEALKARGVAMYLASGTDENYVLEEAALLGVDKYFGPHIYGAQRDYKAFSKKMVIDRIIKENDLHGAELIGFGDGYVEIENIKSVGGFAVGVASNEAERAGIDEWKKERLTRAKADIIVPDYSDIDALIDYLFVE